MDGSGRWWWFPSWELRAVGWLVVRRLAVVEQRRCCGVDSRHGEANVVELRVFFG